MERREYLALREKIVARYERETARYERDMEALERVWAIATEDDESVLILKSAHEIVEQGNRGPEEPSRSLAPSEGSPAVQNGQNGALKRWSLRKEIEKLLPEFGADEDVYSGKVRRTLEERFPNHTAFMHSASVSSALRRIAQSGDLVLVSKGTGNDPHLYRKPENVDAEQESNEDTLLKSGP